MAESKYEGARPAIPADVRRAVEVQSGHACAVSRCEDHTYLEIHHINQDREDNRIENLILLCDKHHRMAHADVIDRKALRKYKKQLEKTYSIELIDRVTRLEQLLTQKPKRELEPVLTEMTNTDVELPVKIVTPRSRLIAITLEQVALAKFEKDRNIYLEREIRFTKGDAKLMLDAVRQDDSLNEDLVVEVRWLRKRYLDAPIWLQQVEASVSVYELITARKAKGVLILIVPKASMKQIADLPFTAAAYAASSRKPEVVIYTYDDLGFDPGPLAADLFGSNIGTTEQSR